MNKPKIVLDTNVLLMSIGRKSDYRPIFDALLDGTICLVITNEILSEYVEILERKANILVASNIAEILVKSRHVERIAASFRWNLITADPDDNKFVDCAVAGNVKYIVSKDKHFSILKNIPFPKVDVLTIDEFMEELETLKSSKNLP